MIASRTESTEDTESTALGTFPTYSEIKTKVRTPHLLRKMRSAVPLDFEGGLWLDDDQREAIAYYNRELTPLGWLPVTTISPELDRALDVFDADHIRTLVDAVVAGDRDVPKRKTLVRLLWSNY
jgi:hypothetical protein